VTDEFRRELLTLIPALRAFAFSFVRNETDMDDLVQECLVKAIANQHLFTPGTNLKAWLFTILRHSFTTSFHKAKRVKPGSTDEMSEVPVSGQTQDWSAYGQDIRRALMRLSPAHREVLIMIGALGTSYEEAAGILGCSLGTVKSRLNRARHQLAKELGITCVDEVAVANPGPLPSHSWQTAPL
jgi:RNA polymerase sigma factor (sigma-70 family)